MRGGTAGTSKQVDWLLQQQDHQDIKTPSFILLVALLVTLCLGKQTVPSRCDVDLIFGAGVHDSAAVLPVKGMLPVQDLANFDLPERMLTRIVLIGILTLGDREVSMRPERPAPFIPYCEMGTQHLGWAAVSGKLSAPPELRS